MERATDDMKKWRILLMDLYRDPTEGYLGLTRISGNGETRAALELDLQTRSRSEMPEMLVERLQTSLNGKAVCTTTGKSIALVLGDPQAGDRIFVAKGASFPLILRSVKAETAGNEPKKECSRVAMFELVGGSYVHGIMDGEVREMMDLGQIPEETVFLV